jgi:hypothetical protein
MRWAYKGGYPPHHTSGKGVWECAVSSSATDPRSFASSIYSISKHKEFLFHSWTRLLKPSLIPTPKCTLLTAYTKDKARMSVVQTCRELMLITF